MSPPLVSHAVAVKIPSTIPYGGGGGEDTTQHDLVNENDVFGSRASSVTVMSDQDRVSLFSPFASPVSHGVDTPIIRTHPFAIRTAPLSLVSPGEMRKGSQSESDLCDGLHLPHVPGHVHVGGGDSACPELTSTGPLPQHQPCTGSAKTIKKLSSSLSRSGDLSTSHLLLHSSLKKHCSLVSSVPSSRHEGVVAHMMSCNQLPSSLSSSSFELSGDTADDHGDSVQSFIRTLATCPIVSTCSLRADNAVTIAPGHKPVLSPDHTHFAPRSLTSNSSLDSGYDQSLSFTDSARDSCPELTGNYSYGIMCSVRNGMCSNKSGMVCSNKGVCVDSSSTSCGQVAGGELDGADVVGCRRPLQLDMLAERQEASTVLKGTHNGMGEGGKKALFGSKLGQNATGELPNTLRNGHVRNTVMSAFLSTFESSSIAICDNSPSEDDDLSSLSPDPTNHQLDLDDDVSQTITESMAISQDPLQALPHRRLTNHIRNLSGGCARTDDCNGPDNTIKPSAVVLSTTRSQVNQRQHGNDATSSLGDAGIGPLGPLHNLPCSSSVPSSLQSSHRTARTPTSSATFSSCKTMSSEASHDSTSDHESFSAFHTNGSAVPISPPPTHASSLSSPPCHPSPNRDQQPSSVAGTKSPCDSEADSGRSTKTSHKTGELDSSLISEILYDTDSDCTPVLSSLHLGCFDEGGDSSSSPPLIGQYRDEHEEEKCWLGREESQSFRPPLPPSLSTKLIPGHHDNETRNNTFTRSSSATTSSNGYSGDCDSIGHSQQDCRGCAVADSPSERSLRYHRNPSLLHQRLHDHDNSLLVGKRPSALEKFDDFVQIPLPDLEEFHLDSPSLSAGLQEEAESHGQQMSDFGHSLFVG